MNRDKYVESYKTRNGSTKNANKSYNRYLEGVNKQNNQANRQAKFKANELKAQQEREALNG
tara:strand:+ start:2763 stop:2945 length:183 start_codon:yes stop_codon:yes gene_type:complete